MCRDGGVRSVEVMTNRPDHTHPSGGPSAPGTPSISWSLVIGLGSLGLLWPLTGLLGLTDLLGGAVRSALLLFIIGATWVGVVGLGRLARPVMTLVLTGVVAGIFMALAAVLLGDAGGARAILVAIWTIAGQGLLGTITGLLALSVQRVRT